MPFMYLFRYNRYVAARKKSKCTLSIDRRFIILVDPSTYVCYQTCYSIKVKLYAFIIVFKGLMLPKNNCANLYDFNE